MKKQGAGPYDVLAEVLVSKRVGLDHIRLVGELIVAQARMNASPGSASTDLIEGVIDIEDKYKEAWEELKLNRDPALRGSKLENLRRSLEDAIIAFENAHRQLRS